MHNYFNRSIFRFENYWLDYVGCHHAIRSSWEFTPHGSPMHAFSHSIAHTRIKHKAWCASSLSSLDFDLINTENAITSLKIFDSPTAANLSHLEELYAKFTAIQRQNSSKWSQQARMQWVCDGNMDTKFFHSINRIRKHFNSIARIRDMNGSCFMDQASIKQSFLNFYSCLWSNS